MYNIKVQVNQAGKICGLTLPKDSAPPNNGEDLFDWTNNLNGTIPEYNYNETAR